MKKKIMLIVLVLFLFGLVSCGGGDGGGDDVFRYDANKIKQCDTNGYCQGCCSWHGGVACYDSNDDGLWGADDLPVCADGTPMSETCMNKSCNSCFICPNDTSDPMRIGNCTLEMTDVGGEDYYYNIVDSFNSNIYCDDTEPPNISESYEIPPEHYHYRRVDDYGEPVEECLLYKMGLKLYYNVEGCSCRTEPPTIEMELFGNIYPLHVTIIDDFNIPSGSCIPGVTLIFFFPNSDDEIPQYSYEDITAIIIGGYRIEMFGIR